MIAVLEDYVRAPGGTGTGRTRMGATVPRPRPSHIVFVELLLVLLLQLQLRRLMLLLLLVLVLLPRLLPHQVDVLVVVIPAPNATTATTAVLRTGHRLVRLVADVAAAAIEALAAQVLHLLHLLHLLQLLLLLLLRRVEAGRDGDGLVRAAARPTRARVDVRLDGHRIAGLGLQQLAAVLLHAAAAVGVHEQVPHPVVDDVLRIVQEEGLPGNAAVRRGRVVEPAVPHGIHVQPVIGQQLGPAPGRTTASSSAGGATPVIPRIAAQRGRSVVELLGGATRLLRVEGVAVLPSDAQAQYAGSPGPGHRRRMQVERLHVRAQRRGGLGLDGVAATGLLGGVGVGVAAAAQVLLLLLLALVRLVQLLLRLVALLGAAVLAIVVHRCSVLDQNIQALRRIGRLVFN